MRKISFFLTLLICFSCSHLSRRDPASIKKFLSNYSRIEIYSDERWCYPCKLEKRYLDSIGVSYIVYDARDQSCKQIARNPQFCDPPYVPVTVFIEPNGKKYFKVSFDSGEPWTLFEDWVEIK